MAELVSNQEKSKIVRISGDNYRSDKKVSRILNEIHPNRTLISNSTVPRINQIFNRTGSVTKQIEAI